VTRWSLYIRDTFDKYSGYCRHRRQGCRRSVMPAGGWRASIATRYERRLLARLLAGINVRRHSAGLASWKPRLLKKSGMAFLVVRGVPPASDEGAHSFFSGRDVRTTFFNSLRLRSVGRNWILQEFLYKLKFT